MKKSNIFIKRKIQINFDKYYRDYNYYWIACIFISFRVAWL